jgi:hypothetical protein
VIDGVTPKEILRCSKEIDIGVQSKGKLIDVIDDTYRKGRTRKE